MKTIAIYLPQFHPIPENDKWWGKGFTEWTNVTKAKPLFKGHYQPHLPSDLGFYDLRNIETQKEQVALAQEYGIDGFCYYHYWFEGKRLLERPFNQILENKDIDFPIMLCWANETWSRRWLGEEIDVLMHQGYSMKDHRNHANWLVKAFRDERYIRIDNRPVFAIYRPFRIPEYQKALEIYKEEVMKHGLPEPYIIASNSHDSTKSSLVDAYLNFEPQLSLLPNAFIDGFKVGKLVRNLKYGIISGKLKIYDYKEVKKIMMNRPIDKDTFPCVFVGWDNSARKSANGIIIKNNCPKIFYDSLVDAYKKLKENKQTKNGIIFLNAWNEWAEGNHLEPCHECGREFLKQVKQFKQITLADN
jgi:hypothetical protein